MLNLSEYPAISSVHALYTKVANRRRGEAVTPEFKQILDKARTNSKRFNTDIQKATNNVLTAMANKQASTTELQELEKYIKEFRALCATGYISKGTAHGK